MPDAPLASLSAASPHASRVYVTLADLDGWDIYVEIDGCIVLTEHCTDWHRVERRRATLAGDLGRARGQVGRARRGGRLNARVDAGRPTFRACDADRVFDNSLGDAMTNRSSVTFWITIVATALTAGLSLAAQGEAHR